MEIKKQILNENKNVMLKPIKKEDNLKPDSRNIPQKDDSKKQTISGQPSKISSIISKLEGMGGRIPGMMGQRPSAQFKPKQGKDALSKSVLVFSEETSKEEKTNLNKTINEGSRPMTSTKYNISKNASNEESNFKSKYKLKFKNENDELIILKEKIFCDYVEELYKLFLLYILIYL